jgi:hypothetical protein
MTYTDALRALNTAAYAAFKSAPQKDKAALKAIMHRTDELCDDNAFAASDPA